MAYFAEVDQTSLVTRVVVCDTVQYLLDRLGGLWSETKIADPVEAYAGIGYHDIDFAPPHFLAEWVQPDSPANGYAKGAWSWHNGQPWRSNHANNTNIPGSGPNWRDYLTEWPQWNNSNGGCQIGDKCTQTGKHWINTVDDNTSPPQQPGSGWVQQ